MTCMCSKPTTPAALYFPEISTRGNVRYFPESDNYSRSAIVNLIRSGPVRSTRFVFWR